MHHDIPLVVVMAATGTGIAVYLFTPGWVWWVLVLLALFVTGFELLRHFVWIAHDDASGDAPTGALDGGGT